MRADEFMTAEDPGAFDGFAPLPQRQEAGGESVQCPTCKGHGGWNLKLNAYGIGRHFKCQCHHCWGWGWVPKGKADHSCAGNADRIATTGRCLNLYKCRVCGSSWELDSSD